MKRICFRKYLIQWFHNDDATRCMFFFIYKYVYRTMILCDDEATRWLCLIHTYIYIHIIILWWWDVMRTRWWLRSTTGPYGRTFLEAAYGEIIFHSTEAVWKMIAREEWLEYRHDALSMFDIPGSTPMWAQYILFSGF